MSSCYLPHLPLPACLFASATNPRAVPPFFCFFAAGIKQVRGVPVTRRLADLEDFTIPVETHVAYALTWFSISLTSAVVGFLKVRKALGRAARGRA